MTGDIRQVGQAGRQARAEVKRVQQHRLAGARLRVDQIEPRRGQLRRTGLVRPHLAIGGAQKDGAVFEWATGALPWKDACRPASSGATAAGAVEAQAIPRADDRTAASGSPLVCETWQYPQLSTAWISMETRCSSKAKDRLQAPTSPARCARRTTGLLRAYSVRPSRLRRTCWLVSLVNARTEATNFLKLGTLGCRRFRSGTISGTAGWIPGCVKTVAGTAWGPSAPERHINAGPYQVVDARGGRIRDGFRRTHCKLRSKRTATGYPKGRSS